jgi:hypothetical protein
VLAQHPEPVQLDCRIGERVVDRVSEVIGHCGASLLFGSVYSVTVFVK